MVISVNALIQERHDFLQNPRKATSMVSFEPAQHCRINANLPCHFPLTDAARASVLQHFSSNRLRAHVKGVIAKKTDDSWDQMQVRLNPVSFLVVNAAFVHSQ